MPGPATLAWHDCRVTASVQGENPGSKGHGQPGWKPQCQAQRTSIPPSAGAACGRSQTNGGSAWNASCAPTVMNSRFRAGEHCNGNNNIQPIHDKNIRLLLLRSLQTAWDRFGRTGMFEVGGVAVLLGTTVLISANRSCGQRRSWRSWPCDRARSVKWPWTFGSGSSAVASPKSQNEPALTASDFRVSWTWTFCRRGAIAPVRPT